MMKSFQWLHFSDLHLCSDDEDSRDARDRLINYIEGERKENRLEFDYVFITGDIADKSGYDETEGYLKKLFRALGLKNSKQSLSKVYWAVGNHDISRVNVPRRIEIINKIRDKNDKYSLSDCLDKKNHKEDASVLFNGMDLYKEEYRKILKRDLEATLTEPHILKELPELNIVVLNTCLTSADDEDAHHLFIQSKQLRDVFNKIQDKNKPLFVIGHHGRDFFYMDEMDVLSEVFDEMGVDVYLCGHNHKLGFAIFPDTERDIYQFTCGGGPSFTPHTNLSFMHGRFDGEDCSIQIKPYSYRVSGDKTWSEDEHLCRRMRSSNKFLLGRLSAQTETLVETGAADHSEDFVNILHLSDLQFGITANTSGKKEVAIQTRKTILEERLIKYLKSNIPDEWKPDIVVISGDLAWSATKNDYKKFSRWLKTLMKTLDLSIDHLIICTGNHDINSDAASRNSENGNISRDRAQEELGCEQIYNNFNEFISFCKGEIEEGIQIKPLKNILPEGSDGKYLYGFRELMGIRFNVLNTSWYCRDNKKEKDSKRDKEKLWIGEEFVRDLESNLLYNDCFAVTVFHHPFDWLAPAEGDDNSDVKQYLLKLSDIILCGHVHTQVKEPTFEHNKSQIFQSGALWAGNHYSYESRIIRINKRTRIVRQLTLDYNSKEARWEHTINIGPNKDKSYPINHNNTTRATSMEETQ